MVLASALSTMDAVRFKLGNYAVVAVLVGVLSKVGRSTV